MKVEVHPWSPDRRYSESLSRINTDQTIEIEVLPGKYITRVCESCLYDSMMRQYLFHDDRFVVKGVEHYEQYPLAGKCDKYHGSYKGNPQTTAWFLLVADKPFTVERSSMIQDGETYGYEDSPRDSYTDEAELIVA